MRPYRFELGALLMIAAIGVALAGGTAVRLMALGIPNVCFRPERPDSCLDYARAVDQYFNTLGTWQLPAAMAGLAFPSIAALLLGLGLIGKEIDQRTIVFAWSMSPSRTRWLSTRLLPALLITVIASLIGGGLADVLQSLKDPSVDAARNFEGFGLRGVPIVGVGLVVLGTGLLVGAVIGRVLPALLVSGAVVIGVLVGIAGLNDVLLRGDATFVPSSADVSGARILDTFIQTPEGEIITWDEAYVRYGAAVDQLSYGDPSGATGSGLSIVIRIVPADAYPWASNRLALFEGAAGLLAIALTYLVVLRRRP